MKHTHQTAFGKPVEAVQIEAHDIVTVDKWEVLTALTDASEAYGLNHRTLGVLKALMTFLPTRIISPKHLGAVVFPSNRTLARRLNDMPDSTLRRHLAALVEAGIVSRHDSANRKRFARRAGAGDQIAFGFDLSPLARHRMEIAGQAAHARRTRAHLAALRAQVAQARQQVLTDVGPSPLTDEVSRLLRRKPSETDLDSALARLEALKDCPVSDEMSGADIQNERHIQYVDKYYSDSEGARDDSSCKPDLPVTQVARAEREKVPEITEVTEVCQAYKSYFPEPMRDWHDLAGVADRLAPMMGIEPFVFKEAMARMGVPGAVTAVLCILERLSDIANPGGYLRRLSQTARAGGFDARPMLDALVHRGKLSADNLFLC